MLGSRFLLYCRAAFQNYQINYFELLEASRMRTRVRRVMARRLKIQTGRTLNASEEPVDNCNLSYVTSNIQALDRGCDYPPDSLSVLPV